MVSLFEAAIEAFDISTSPTASGIRTRLGQSETCIQEIYLGRQVLRADLLRIAVVQWTKSMRQGGRVT